MSRRTMPPTPQTRPGMLARYRDRIWDETRHDPYAPPGKYPSPARCASCGAVYQRGRWTWVEAPPGARTVSCPACRRIRERAPAGLLTLEGARLLPLRSELVALVDHESARERAEHPMNRIMHLDDRDGRIEIATTDIHLPQRLGKAIQHAHRGALSIDYAEDEYAVRVTWRA